MTTCDKYTVELEDSYYYLILEDVAAHFLTLPLCASEQHHFLEPNCSPHYFGTLGCLESVDLIVYEFDDISEAAGGPDRHWILPFRKARVNFLLAWARLYTMKDHVVQTDQSRNFPEDDGFIGDNSEGPLYPSSWGTPKSMLVVARRDLNWIQKSLSGAPHLFAGREEVEEWLDLACKIHEKVYEAQNTRKLNRDAAISSLHEPMIDKEFKTRIWHLRDREGKRAIHEAMETERWAVSQ